MTCTSQDQWSSSLLIYLGALTASFGPGSALQTIRLDSVICDGTESNILECFHNPVVSDACTHQDDAGVICQTGSRLESNTSIK